MLIFAAGKGISDVSITSTGVECDYVNLCCWQGNTADSCDSTNGDYSGCNRTVCDWRAAAYTCKDFNLLGYKWRLASEGEMQNWLDNSRNLGNSGLQLCDNSSNIQSSQCGGSTNCLGPSSSECNPNNIWTNDLYLETISSNQRYFIPGQSTTEYNVYAIASEITNDSLSSFSVKMNISTEYDIITENITDASSVRCVADYCQFKFGNACKRCSATECLECEEFYELDNPKSSNACTRTEPYARIGDYVITAFNMGDHPDLPLSPSVALHNSPAEADFTYNECWIDTSTDCGNSNSDYSACGRTICDALAAKEICDSAGFTLPDEGLMKLMTAYGYTSYLEENAQLCSENSGTNYAYCESQQGCMNECAPSNVWGIDATGRAPNMTAKINLALYFNPPYMNLEYHVPNRGHSVRCVVP